jgi:ribonuclease P protein component
LPCCPFRLWISPHRIVSLYWPRASEAHPDSLLDLTCETDLSAQRATAEAAPRLPAENGVQGRTCHPQASPRARPEAPLRLAGARPAAVQRRNRLSRSRDFDAVYRHGRSVSTRYLVLYRFEREGEEDGDVRLGIAIPKKIGTAVTRNRIKRRLREAWRSMLSSVPAGTDYVVLVRAPLAEAEESRGADWLRERLEEVLGKARA